MPMIVPYTPQFRYQNPDTGGARLKPADFGGSIAASGQAAQGAQLKEAGRNLQIFGTQVQKASDKWDEAVVSDAFTKYQAQALQKKQELEKLKGENALGKADGSQLSVSQDTDAWTTSTRESMTKSMSGWQRKMFDHYADRYDMSFKDWATGYEQRERDTWEDGLFKSRAKVLADTMAENYGKSSEMFMMAEAQLAVVVNSMAARKGLGKEQAGTLYSQLMGETMMGIGETLIAEERLGEARSLVRDYGSALGGKNKALLSARITSAARALEARARAEQERAETQNALSSVSTLLQDTAGMPQAERESVIMEAIAQEPDIKRRQRMASVARSEIEFEKTRISAQTQKEIVDFYDQTDGLSPVQKMDVLERNNTLTDAARTKLRDHLTTDWKRETPRNQEAFSNLLVKIDEGKKRGGIDPKNEQAIYAYASDRGLTPSQTKKAIEYAREGGAVGSVKFSEAKAIWTRLTGKKNMPQEAFDALRTQVPQGHAPSTAELEKLISQLYMSKGVIPRDVLWDKSASLYDAIKDKSTSNWLPDVTDAEKEEYAPIVRAMGYKGTDLETAIKEYKRDIVMGVRDVEADQ